MTKARADPRQSHRIDWFAHHPPPRPAVGPAVARLFLPPLEHPLRYLDRSPVDFRVRDVEPQFVGAFFKLHVRQRLDRLEQAMFERGGVAWQAA